MTQFDPFDYVYLGNDIQTWTIALLIFAAVAAALLVFKRILVTRLVKLAARTETQVDDVAAAVLSRTKYFFIVAAAALAASLHLTLTPTGQLVVRNTVIIAAMIQLGVWSNGLIGYWVQAYAMRRGESGAAATTLGVAGIVARGIMWVIFLLVALDTVGVNITALITGLGIGGIAVALAVQNILGDLFAALSIIVDRPFEVGDFIVIDTFSGTVEKVGMKSTRVRSITGEQVIFSNADLLRSRVRNMRRMAERRIVFTFGVTYDTDPEVLARVPDMVRTVIEAQPSLRFDRAHFFRFGDSSLDFEVVYFVTTPDYYVYMNAQQQFSLTLLRDFREANVNFAIPTRTVVVKGGTAVEAVELAATGGAGDPPSRPPRDSRR